MSVFTLGCAPTYTAHNFNCHHVNAQVRQKHSNSHKSFVHFFLVWFLTSLSQEGKNMGSKKLITLLPPSPTPPPHPTPPPNTLEGRKQCGKWNGARGLIDLITTRHGRGKEGGGGESEMHSGGRFMRVSTKEQRKNSLFCEKNRERI